MATKAKKQESTEVVIGYKGFDKDFKCHGFQYEVGKSYEHKGAVKACLSGFHFCKHPLDVLSYYAVAHSNRYALVEGRGDTDCSEGDKIACGHLTVKAEIGIPGLIKAAVEWAKTLTHSDAGDGAHSATAGDSANSATSGYSTRSEASGPNAVAANAGSGLARAGEGGAIFIVERDDECRILSVFASKVGENGIKAGVLYALIGGKPVEAA